MTTKDTDTHDPTPATEPLALKLTEGLGHTVPRPRWWVSLHKRMGGDVMQADVCGLHDDPVACITGVGCEAHARLIAAALDAYKGATAFTACKQEPCYSCGQGGSKCRDCVA